MQSQHVQKDFSEIEKLVSIMTFDNHEEFSQEIRKKYILSRPTDYSDNTIMFLY